MTEPRLSWVMRLRPGLCGLVLLGGWTLLGGPVGVSFGAVGAALSWRVLGNVESPDTTRSREALRRDLPVAVDLLGSCLRSGGALAPALDMVAGALGGPIAGRFSLIGHRLALGMDPVAVWTAVTQDAELAALGRAVARAHDSGAPIASAIAALAEELRADARAESEARAKGIEVRAAAPLGLCFLPAFLLIGVIPLVAGVLSSLELLG